MLFVAALSLLVLSFSYADPLWVRTFSGPSANYDEIHAIGVDSAGNVVVSGESYVADEDEELVTIKYRPDGDTAWLRHFNPGTGLDGATALAVDRAGNTIVTGYAGSQTLEYGDWVTIKYSPSGESLWSATYDFGDQDRPTAVAVDSAGNSYVTGRAGRQDDLDIIVVKYDPLGNEVWRFRYDGGSDEIPWALAVDKQGNAYVTGQTMRGTGDLALVIWKLGLGGESLWANVYAGPAGSHMRGLAVATDDWDNVVVAGSSYDTLTFGDYLTVKYGPNGDTLWARRYNGPGNRGDQVQGLAIDRAGNVYVTGTSAIDAQGHYNCATVKLSPDGVQRWLARYIGPRYYDRACGLVLDAEANVYVAGSSVNSNGDWDVVTLKYDSSGNKRWAERFDMPSTYDEAYVMALSSQGNLYVAGRTEGDTSGIDYLLLCYGTAGGLAERGSVEARSERTEAIIARGVLWLQPGSNRGTQGAGLQDICGREVMRLWPGANNVSELSPGVYFITESAGHSRQTPCVTRVILTR
ncbi:MAG: SBBP repeat-containing protein [candidate division WOR-3 bacterium]